MYCQSINDEFYQEFQKIYSKQEVEDSSEAILDFFDWGGVIKPLEYLKSEALTNEEINEIEGEITLSELKHSLVKKMIDYSWDRRIYSELVKKVLGQPQTGNIQCHQWVLQRQISHLSFKNRHHSPAQERAEGPDNHWKLQTNLTPFNPLQACHVLNNPETGK